VAVFAAILALNRLVNWLLTLLIAAGLPKSKASLAQVGLKGWRALTACPIGPALLTLSALQRLSITLLGGAGNVAQAILYSTAPGCYRPRSAGWGCAGGRQDRVYFGPVAGDGLDV
jgi:hypothetical protein